MAAKREQVLWQSVWNIAKKWERTYGLKGALSASILAFDKLSSETQQKLVYLANSEQLESSEIPDTDQEFRNWIRGIVDEAQAIPSKKTPARKTKSSKSA